MYSPAGDGQVRHLLEQRLERSAHARYPSNSLSDFDTPSLYSRPRFTPRVDDDEDYIRQNHPLSHPFSDRIRLADPSQSSIDFDSDQPEESYDTQSFGHLDYDSDDDQDDEGTMSELGPKMRFHSPAPWEEPEESSQGPSCSGKKRGIGFGISSPRTSTTSRPSMESTRSQSKPKKSSDTSSSQSSGRDGALRSLAQASISTTSLVPSMSSAATRLRPQMSKGHPETPNHSRDPSPLPSPSNQLQYTPLRDQRYNRPHFPFASSAESINRTDSGSPSGWSQSESTDEGGHPYANPKHALRQVGEKAEFQYPLDYDKHTDRLMVSRSDSSVTVMESPSSSSGLTKVATESSISSVNMKARNRMSTIYGRDISSPIAFNRESAPFVLPEPKSPGPQFSNIPGWTERSSSPTFTLISLEEARAQRIRSVTAQATMQTSGALVFPTQELEPIRSIDTTPPVTVRGRARSISAGVRAKQVLSSMKVAPTKPERRDSEPTVPVIPTTNSGIKPLRHKKSGFMRIFNGRDKERGSLPPVPQLSGAYSSAPHSLMKPATITTYRVPVPSVSSPTSSEHMDSDTSSPTVLSHSVTAPLAASPKRTPPPPIDTLRIKGSTSTRTVTNLPKHARPTPLSVSDIDQDSNGAWITTAGPPQSAPPYLPDFPSLKLRPVSSAFSTQFGYILTNEPEREELDSNSPSTARSPVTPGLFTYATEPAKADTTPAEAIQDQSATIQALQEQIISAKRAWQMQIWELEGQLKDLRAEVEEARSLSNDGGEYCSACGRGPKPSESDGKPHSVLHRPRAQTGVSSRFGSTR